MHSTIYQEIKESTNLIQVRDGLVRVFSNVEHTTPNKHLGYVSGIISSDGPQYVKRNMQTLHTYTESLRTHSEFPIFSAVDVFGNGMHEKMEEITFEYKLREKHFITFWREVLESGHITDIFMTPRWDKSQGAIDEYNTAQKLGITIHTVETTLLQ